MPEFTLPCEVERCPNFSAEQQEAGMNQQLCRGIFNAVVGAGGAGFLEVNPCPVYAILDIGGGSSAIHEEVSAKLGIIGVTESDGPF